MADSTTTSSLAILARSPVFRAAPTADLERLAPLCLCERYRRGTKIVRRGTAGEALAVVGRGKLKATFPSPNVEGEFVIAMFRPGDVFGEVAVFDRQARIVEAVAINDAEVLFVPRFELLSLIERKRPADLSITHKYSPRHFQPVA